MDRDSKEPNVWFNFKGEELRQYFDKRALWYEGRATYLKDLAAKMPKPVQLVNTMNELTKFVGVQVHYTLAWTSQRICCGETFRMPCGFIFTIHSVPDGGFTQSVPCPCGNLKHWLIEVHQP